MDGTTQARRAGRSLTTTLRMSSALIALIAAAPYVWAQDAAPSIQPEDSEEVIVTASRRSEIVRKIPTAVSAYSGDRLREAQIATLGDLVATTPNVQIGSWGPVANVFVRGVGNTQLTAGADTGVALHVDGVYLGQSALAVSTFLDVERVEILRGPQGTLFGRNATGGAVNIIPKRPTETFEAAFDATLGLNPGVVRTQGHVSGPLSSDGTLLGRFSFVQNYNEGFSENLAPGQPRRLDDLDAYGVRGQLEWRPSSEFSARLSLEYNSQDDNGYASYLVGSVSGVLPVEIQGAPKGDPERREVYANHGALDRDALTANLALEWQIGSGDLKLLLSYNETSQFILNDGDGTAVDFTSTYYWRDANQYYAELLYASDRAMPFRYIVGLNYFHEDMSEDISVPTTFLPIPVDLGGDIVTKSYAAFVHAEYDVSPSARIFAGARYSTDEKDADEYNVFAGTMSHSRSWNRLTYEVGVSWDFSDSVTGYAKYATGYKGGGFSAGSLTVPFDPETNGNFEIGLKGSYFDGMLRANLAAFHMKYDNLQVNQVVGVSAAVTNAAKATVDGIEAEIVLHPTSDLHIELNGAWLDARFDEFLTADSARPSLGILDLAGHRLAQAPEFTLSTGVYYDVPLLSGLVTLGAHYDWKDRVYFSEFNLPVSSQGAAGKLDLTARYTSEDERWSASIFALNVTDETIRSNTIVVSALLGSIALGSVQPGRQIGLSIGYRF